MLKSIAAIASAAVLSLSASLPAVAEVEATQVKASFEPVAEALKQAESTFAENAIASFSPMGTVFGGPSMFFDWGRHNGVDGFRFDGLKSAKAYEVIFSYLNDKLELSCRNDAPSMSSVRGEMLAVDRSTCSVTDKSGFFGQQGYIGDMVILSNTSVTTGKVVTARVNWTI